MDNVTRRWSLRAPGLVVAAVVATLAAPAWAGMPTEQLKAATDRVLQIVQDPELAKPSRIEDRRQQIRAVSDQIFDWEETAKLALGIHRRGRTPQQMEEFASLFADLVERSYVSKIESYSGEKILYLGEKVEDGEATVQTKLVTKSNTEIPIDYRMRKDGSRWKAFDVKIENVSLVANYRSQFNRIVQQSGYDELVKRLKAKQEEILYEEAERGKKKP